MRKLLFILVLFSAQSLIAQEKLVIDAGTVLTLHSVKEVLAREVKHGDKVLFKTAYDTYVQGRKILPAGYIVKGTVQRARKSGVAGTKGLLDISIDNLVLPNGQHVALSDRMISIEGKNRTPAVLVATLFIWPCIFISGSKAVMPEGYEVDVHVQSNTTINFNW